MYSKIITLIIILIFIFGCNKSIIISNNNTELPRLIDKPFFIYPPAAREDGISGKVHLILLINNKGIVDSVMVDKSSGYDILDKSAIAFAKQFKYIPAKFNGKPTQIYVGHSVDYTLTQPTEVSKNYISRVKELQHKIMNASPEKSAELQNELLTLHKKFIESNSDYIGYNQVIKELVNRSTFNRWSSAMNEWPLHFIVFDDFQKCYPNSVIDSKARQEMFEYLKKDFETAKIISLTDRQLISKRMMYDEQINNFIREDYADVLPDSLNYLLQ